MTHTQFFLFYDLNYIFKAYIWKILNFDQVVVKISRFENDTLVIMCHIITKSIQWLSLHWCQIVCNILLYEIFYVIHLSCNLCKKYLFLSGNFYYHELDILGPNSKTAWWKYIFLLNLLTYIIVNKFYKNILKVDTIYHNSLNARHGTSPFIVYDQGFDFCCMFWVGTCQFY